MYISHQGLLGSQFRPVAVICIALMWCSVESLVPDVGIGVNVSDKCLRRSQPANKLQFEDAEHDLWCWSGMCTDCLSGWFSPQLSWSPPAIWCEAAIDIWEPPWVCPSFFPFRSLVSHQHFQSIKRVVFNPNSTYCFLIFLSRVFTGKSNAGWKHTACQYSAKWLALFSLFILFKQL